MTVGELKQALADYPDDMPVVCRETRCDYHFQIDRLEEADRFFDDNKFNGGYTTESYRGKYPPKENVPVKVLLLD